MSPQETFPGHTLIALLKEFSLPSLSKVIYFEFRVSRIRNAKIPGLTTFMASVETIATEKSAFPHISTSTPPKGGDPALKVLFPALKTLTFGAFTPPPEDSCKTNKVRDPVSKYVMGRIARGQAISVIDFTAVNFDVLPNLAFLTRANGVKVLTDCLIDVKLSAAVTRLQIHVPTTFNSYTFVRRSPHNTSSIIRYSLSSTVSHQLRTVGDYH